MITLFLIIYFCSDIELFTIRTVCAMEPQTAYDIFMAKLNSVQADVDYNANQLVESTEKFQDALRMKSMIDPANIRAMDNADRFVEECRCALKDSQTNLSSDQRMLRILQNRMNNNDYTLPTTTSSLSTKRPFDS